MHRTQRLAGRPPHARQPADRLQHDESHRVRIFGRRLDVDAQQLAGPMDAQVPRSAGQGRPAVDEN